MNLNQVTLPVTQMSDTVRFYQTLGFELIVDTPHYARFACPEGDSTFSLSLEENAVNGPRFILNMHSSITGLLTYKKKALYFPSYQLMKDTCGEKPCYLTLQAIKSSFIGQEKTV